LRFLDLSQPLFDGCPNCPAHPPISIRTEAHSDGGEGSWQIEFFDFASHSGSHLDAPRHKIAGGASLSQLPLETFAGPAIVADLRGLAPSTDIGAELLAQALPSEICGQIVLICTGWGDLRAQNELWLLQSPRLAPDGAQWLVEAGARAVGIDHFSIGGAQEPQNARTHQILLGNGVWVLEELHFPAEIWELSWPQTLLALPLNLSDGSGAPCRPVLMLDAN
jgi:kynurenine formamidase